MAPKRSLPARIRPYALASRGAEGREIPIPCTRDLLLPRLLSGELPLTEESA